MAIRVEYTPYKAVGQLAQAAGKAQQAVREQNYEFQATQQAKQIAASLQSQRESIAANMAQFNANLEFEKAKWEDQQEYNEAQLELQNKQVEAQQAAAGFNYLAQKKQLAQQAEEFEQQMALKEQAFQLETAMQQEQLEMAKEKGQAELDAFLNQQETIQQNVEDWMQLEGQIPDEIYTSGLMSARMGEVPRLTTQQQASLTPLQQYNIQTKIDTANEKAQQTYVKQQTQELTSGDINRATKTASSLLEDKPRFRGGGYPGIIQPLPEEDWVVPKYADYMKVTGYDNKNDVQKEHLDNIFDAAMDDQGFDSSTTRAFLESIRSGKRGYQAPKPTLQTVPSSLFQTTTAELPSTGLVKLPDGSIVTVDQLKQIAPTLSQPSSQSADILDQAVDLNTIDFSKWSR